ncbi:MAG: isochorismate synthase [Stigonema ocellatum SAG 48.90 = DSM 106950]|nr:isochorismate synthase [Stigonema ocellatum SAG 48.90 = DSM 106950]
MTVSPCPAHSFVYNRELYQFLLEQERNGIKSNCTQIVNISLEIDLVDPLVVFDHLAQPNQLNFYWENQSKKEAIAALGAVAKLEIPGKDRFIKSEYFIQKCLRKITSFSQTNQPFSGPLFFCGFSFFDKNDQEDNPFPAATVFLPRWQIAVKNERCILVANTIINGGINIENILQTLWEQIERINFLGDRAPHFDFSPAKFSKQSVANPEKFKLSVLSALQTIRNNHLSKVVLADALDVRSNTHFNLFKSLSNLRQLHPNCYIFSLSNGKGQNFIGASPERLISIHNQQLITDALAGSAPRGKTPAEDAANANLLVNSEKERHEHSLVIDFITQSLCQLGLLPQVLAPRLRQLSNIQHLWTPISAIVPANVHPLKIVAQLHPTPAVAGAARDVACSEIRRYESFERGLYAAPLGWVDSNGNCEFIVGIRSALIDGDRARLYAGAGIVAGSDPDKELAEVQLKLQALLKALV